MTSVRRGLFIAFAERYALIALSLAGNILLARLLTPEEIGIYSVSLALIGIVQVLRDFGVGSFLIQQKELTDAHVSTTLGISLIIGTTLGVLLFAFAPAAANFYSEARLTETLRISALNFLILPFGSISLSLLRRDMEFGRIMLVTLVAAIGGFVTTISLAYYGFGPNSMAVGGVVTNLATGVGAWVARRRRRLLLPSLSEWRAVLRFGGQVTAAGVVTSVAMDMNDLVLGKVLGFAPVAIVSRAQGLMNLFHRDVMSAIRGVIYPAFAKAHREGRAMDQEYQKSLTNICAVAWPFYGFVAIFSLEILRLMFGPQWDEAARLVPIFCAAGAVAAMYLLLPELFVAVGRVDLSTKFSLIYQPLRAALIVLAATIFRSVEACAWAYLIAFGIHLPVLFAYKQRCVETDWAALARSALLNLKVTVIALTPALAILAIVSRPESVALPWTSFLAACALTVISWIAALFLLRHPLTADPVVHRVLQQFKSRGKA